jgi:uncharacterized membrane protein/thiol-disulfide isomerase/thioredoxin
VALLLGALLAIPASLSTAHAQAAPPVVHAVLFYSPTCPHCHYVITETLPPLMKKYGDQLQIIGVDVNQPDGQMLFLAALQKFNLEEAGVPFLVVGDSYLVGSADIPEKFPGLIEDYLKQGGVGWPDIPGLAEGLSATEATPIPTQNPTPVVRAALFYESNCSHCQTLVSEIIPPLIEKYGNQLQIYDVDIASPQGEALYKAAIENFNVKLAGVPMLVVGQDVLLGSDIQQKFPGIMEELLARGGTDWPDIPGLGDALAAGQSATPPAPASIEPAIHPTVPPASPQSGVLAPGPLSNFALDPLGNSLSVIILFGMVISIIWSISCFRRSAQTTHAFPLPPWVTPVLCVVGIGVAGYLAYVEVAQVSAVCGPVGDCNTVQQSEYARLFGILPIGVLGMAGYLAIGIAWLVDRLAKGYLADLATISTLVLTALGTLFSIYLTFLEPFIIGATCGWCLTSAVLMTVLMLITVIPGKLAIRRVLSL